MDRFPGQNPNPVLRVDGEGRLTYANAASAQITDRWATAVGGPVPAEWLSQLRAAAETGQPVDLECDRRTYELTVVEIAELDFLNVYGTDVTAARLIERFPDRNPSPVLRMDASGVIRYANPASAALLEHLAARVGEPLPDELRMPLLEVVAGREPGPVTARNDRRTFALTPVAIPELETINVYAADITAEKTIAEFPDQNPNPVFRISIDGTLTYANPASQQLIEGLGCQIGMRLGGDLTEPLLAAVRDPGLGQVEIEAAGRIYALLPIDVPEFGFVNVYGTDVTAARELEQLHRENERLLLNILPEPIAARLRHGEAMIADRFEDVTLLFADIVEFTRLSSGMSADELVGVLNDVFTVFDQLVETYGLEKVKTIGDAYMVVGGLTEPAADHAERVAAMALELAERVAGIDAAVRLGIRFRIGIHCGPVIAGVIGRKKFIYDLWGDTVNVASRMESNGVPGRLQVTAAIEERLRDSFLFEPRGMVDVKGKGPMPTWFLVGRREDVAPGAAAGAAATPPG